MDLSIKEGFKFSLISINFIKSFGMVDGITKEIGVGPCHPGLKHGETLRI